jgi:hypothetical protein
MRRTILLLAGVGCWIAAAVVGQPKLDNLGAWGLAFARPLAMPFLWRSLDDALHGGDPAEAFARAQVLLDALPEWADGHAVFAWRYALEGGDPLATGEARARAAKARLLAALAMLEAARPRAGAHEADLLVWMAFIAEYTARAETGLRELMVADPGLGDPTLLADRYLAAAERMTGRPGLREQRIFLAPRLCAALLQAGDREGALRLLDDTIARCREVRDPDAGHEWQQTLTLVRRCLAGDAAVDAGRLREDPRLEPLLPFLH